MNLSKMCLALATAMWFAIQGTAAPVPVPGSTASGPITDALRLRALLPATAPLLVSPAVLKDGVIVMERRVTVPFTVTRNVVVMVPVTKQVIEKVVQPDGKVVERVRAITEYVAEERPVTETNYTTRVESISLVAKGCKFFVVTKDGKLEILDADKAMARLAKKTAVLTGGSAEVDPRTLELVKPGTLCVIPTPAAATPPPPPLPDEKPRN